MRRPVMQEPCPHSQPHEEEQQHTCAGQLYVEQPHPATRVLLHTVASCDKGLSLQGKLKYQGSAGSECWAASGLVPDDV